jgi:hypothetical protein
MPLPWPPLSPSVGFQQDDRRDGRPSYQAMAMHQQMHRIVSDIEQFPWRLAQQCLVPTVNAIDQVVAIKLRTQHR